MGQVVSQTWYVYARTHDQKWTPEPLFSTLAKADDLQYHMGRFKHVVYKLCLGHYDDICKVYLYQGWRIAKAERYNNRVKITFKNKNIETAWEKCAEVRIDGRSLTDDFNLHYVEEQEGQLVRRFIASEDYQWTI